MYLFTTWKEEDRDMAKSGQHNGRLNTVDKSMLRHIGRKILNYLSMPVSSDLVVKSQGNGSGNVG